MQSGCCHIQVLVQQVLQYVYFSTHYAVCESNSVYGVYSRKSLIQTSVIQIFSYLNPQDNDIHRNFAVR